MFGKNAPNIMKAESAEAGEIVDPKPAASNSLFGGAKMEQPKTNTFGVLG